MNYELTRSGFDSVMREFRPSRYEMFGSEDPRFTTPMHHALKCRDRLYVALRSGLRWLPQGLASPNNWAMGPFYVIPHLRGSLLIVGWKR